MKKHIITTLIILLVFNCMAGNVSALEKVSLQLKWKHQFQFAGYYAAIEKGYYRDAGLEVELLERTPNKTPFDSVLDGDADYGIAGSEIISEWLAEKPVSVLAVIFQHSPVILITLAESGLTNPHQLAGKKTMLGIMRPSADVEAMLVKEGVPLGKLDLLPLSFDITDLIEGHVDVMSVYSTDQPFYLDKMGIDYNIINPTTYGFDFYGDVLFTSHQEIEHHPERVKKFREASLKGWEYALSHVNEMVEYIDDHYNTEKRNLSKEYLRFEAEATRELIMPDIVELGHVNPHRWEKIAQTYVNLGLAESDYSLDGFVYDPDPEFDPTWLYWGIIIVTSVVVILLLILWALIRFNRRLQLAITEREKSEARYRNLIEQSIAGIGVSHEGRILFVNEALCKLFGIEDAETFRSKSPLDYATPESKKKIIERMERIKAGKTVSAEFEQEIIRADGEIRTLSLHVSDIEYEGKQCRQSTFIDITDKKRLQESEERFRLMFQKSPYAIAMTDIDSGALIDVNEMLVQKTGYQREEIIGQTTTSMGFYSKEDRDRFIGQLKENGFVDNLDMKFNTKSDTLDARMSARIIHINKKDYLLTMFEDVTEVIKAEKALSESEGKYRFIAENVNDLIIIVNSQFELMYASPALTKIYGYSEKEFKNKSIFDTVCDQDREKLLEEIRQRLESNVPNGTGQYRVNSKSGAEKWIETHTTYHYDSAGVFERSISVIRDISDRKEAEERIQASLKEKETLLREIHHRVKNNMNVVSSLLSLHKNSTQNEEAKQALQVSQGRVYAMSAVHETLYGSENLAEIDLITYLSKLSNSLIKAYSVDPGKVQLKVDGDEVKIDIDKASPLGLTVNELISNALKYAFQDERKGKIEVTTRKQENQLELIIEDNGIGLPQGFDWKNSSTLGLKLVRNLIENQLNGSIELDTQGGTQFIIKIYLET